jgi:hypothetical protein
MQLNIILTSIFLGLAAGFPLVKRDYPPTLVLGAGIGQPAVTIDTNSIGIPLHLGLGAGLNLNTLLNLAGIQTSVSQ